MTRLSVMFFLFRSPGRLLRRGRLTTVLCGEGQDRGQLGLLPKTPPYQGELCISPAIVIARESKTTEAICISLISKKRDCFAEFTLSEAKGLNDSVGQLCKGLLAKDGSPQGGGGGLICP
jgi:hypothetical protein